MFGRNGRASRMAVVGAVAVSALALQGCDRINEVVPGNGSVTPRTQIQTPKKPLPPSTYTTGGGHHSS
jgi:hypothetical protein